MINIRLEKFRNEIPTLSDVEVEEYFNILQKEKTLRTKKAKQEAWADATRAIKDFCCRFGPITIRDWGTEIECCASDIFDEQGVITTHYEEQEG